jgi:CheY-like chemotaxis protein
MAASAILFADVEVVYDGPAALELSGRFPYGLASLDYKLQGMDGVELCDHLKRVHADAVGVLVAAFADATVHTAAVRQVLSKLVELAA